MTFTRRFLFPLLAAMLLFTGCKATLEPGGAYAPVDQVADLPLFTADAAFRLAYTTLDAVFLFERNNRQTLWAISPNIKHSVDELRVNATQYAKDWAVARQAYVTNPIPSNLDSLKTILAKVQQLSVVAGTVITRYQNP